MIKNKKTQTRWVCKPEKIPETKFFFRDYFPEKKNLLLNELKKLSKLENTLVFFISPKKINKVIPEIKKNFVDRKIVFCREITKKFEEFR